MKILNFEEFMKKYKLKNDDMNESQSQKLHNYHIYPRDSKINSQKVFGNIDNGSMGGPHWTCFYIKDNKSFYFESFNTNPDEFLLNQLPKSIIYHNCKFQEIFSKLCGSYCLYFFYLIERMTYYDTFLKIYFQ